MRGRFTVVDDPEDVDIPNVINLIPFHSHQIKSFSGKMGNFYFPDMDQPLELPDELTGLFRENCMFVLLAGLGGYTGTKMAEALSLMLLNEQKLFITIRSVPFSFEGRNRLTIANEAMERMKTIPNCHFFELDLLRHEHYDLLLSEAFPTEDRYFFKIISRLQIV